MAFITGMKTGLHHSDKERYYEIFKNPTGSEWKTIYKDKEARAIIMPTGDVYGMGTIEETGRYESPPIHADIIGALYRQRIIKAKPNPYETFNEYFELFFAITDHGNGVWVPSESYADGDSRVGEFAKTYMEKAAKKNRSMRFDF